MIRSASHKVIPPMGARTKMMRIRTIVMSMEPKPDVEVFYSYSHRDEELREELERHLSILKRQGVITAWHDRKIGAGTEWKGQIDTHLNTAHVILLLISSDFLASDYCYDIEMRRAMERHAAGDARVIPIILRPVSWKGAPFEKLQALPKDAKPVTSWPQSGRSVCERRRRNSGRSRGIIKRPSAASVRTFPSRATLKQLVRRQPIFRVPHLNKCEEVMVGLWPIRC